MLSGEFVLTFEFVVGVDDEGTHADGKLSGTTSMGDGLFDGCKLGYNVLFAVGY